MFKRWRTLAAAASAMLFPFALSHAAAMHDDSSCTRYNFPSYRDHARFDWNNQEQQGALRGYFHNFWNDLRADDEQPGCFDPLPTGAEDAVPGGNDDFSVTIRFEETDSSNRISDACEDPNCPSNAADFRMDDDNSPDRDVECPDAATCPCYDAIILELPQPLDETAERDGAATQSPNDPIRFFDIVEPFVFDDPQFEEPTTPPAPSAVIRNPMEFDDEFGPGRVELDRIDELGDEEVAAPALPRAALTGTIDSLDDESDATDNEFKSGDTPHDPSADRDSATDSLTRFHMFYPGCDWSRYMTAVDNDDEI